MRSFIALKMKIFVVCFSSLALASSFVAFNKDNNSSLFVASARDDDIVTKETAVGFALPVSFKGKNPIITDFVSTYLFSYFKRDYNGDSYYENFNPFRSYRLERKKGDSYGNYYLKFIVDCFDDSGYDDEDDYDEDYEESYKYDDYYDEDDEYDEEYDYKRKPRRRRRKTRRSKKYKKYYDYEGVEDIEKVRECFGDLVGYFKHENFFGKDSESRDSKMGSFYKYFKNISNTYIINRFKKYIKTRIKILDEYVIPSISSSGIRNSKLNVIKKYRSNEDYKRKRTRTSFENLKKELIKELNSSKPKRNYLYDVVYNRLPREYKLDKLREKINKVENYKTFSELCDFLYKYYEATLKEYEEVLKTLRNYFENVRRYKKGSNSKVEDLIKEMKYCAKSFKFSPRKFYGLDRDEDIFVPIIKTETEAKIKRVTIKVAEPLDKG